MAYKTILLYLDHEQQANRLLQVATTLARKHSAHLLGIYVQPSLQVYVSADVAVPVNLYNDHEVFHKKYGAQLQSYFETATHNEDFPAEWRVHIQYHRIRL